MTAAGPLVLRFVLAVLLAVHACHWLFGAFAGPALGAGGLAATTTYFAATGMSFAFPFVLTTGIVKLIGSFLLFAGFFTRTASLVLIAFELVRVVLIEARWGFFLNWSLDPARGHGLEHSFLILGVLVSLVFTGAGVWSLDGLRARTDEARAAGRARIRDHA